MCYEWVLVSLSGPREQVGGVMSLVPCLHRCARVSQPLDRRTAVISELGAFFFLTEVPEFR